MDPVYDHSKYEADIYEKWEKAKAFEPKGKGDPFTIIMPPPNASDPLHIGHASFVTIEDVIIRYHRMKGQPVLWLPGADHAGIETQFVFEKKLRAQGKSRFDFDRDTLYKMIWDDVQKNKKTMENQLRQLGASCDWTRFKFTLDPKIIKIVYKTFKDLYDEGLIYRGERIVNFCTRCGTAYSQLEVNSIERDDNIYYLDYGSITIATTRPETIFADVAVAVNPKDKRYSKLIGKTATIPLINREVEVISDNLVDKEFGTGALKITPGHDSTDYEIGIRHNLSVISVIDEKGRMINTPAKYVGMEAEDARNEVIKDLEKAGKVKKVEKIHHTIGSCYRDHSIIEPLLSKQWFLKVAPLVKSALKAINEKEVKFVSKRFEKIAKHWYQNLRDWNISRQIVWGIRIPAWRCQKCMEWTITDGEAPKQCKKCGNGILKQDDDTFDTWFSSGQWPFATLKTTFPGDFGKFYPTSLMETAYDILPFWVIRMIMLGIYETGKVPFREILIHGLIRDKDGQKISKSKGNVIDPIEMTEKYGADALRMSLLWGALVENDISLSEENINAQRKFSNKIWNAARFVLQSESKAPRNSIFRSRIRRITKEISKHLDKYQLNQAVERLYSEFWHWFCDECIEDSKKGKISSTDLRWGLESFIKLLHPFMPFLTEKVWENLGNKNLLITSEWPG